jgi:hypothetical protein
MELRNLIREVIEESRLSFNESELINDIIDSALKYAKSGKGNKVTVNKSDGSKELGYIVDLYEATGRKIDELRYKNDNLRLCVLHQVEYNRNDGYFSPDSFIIVSYSSSPVENKKDFIKHVEKKKGVVAHELTHALTYVKAGGKNLSKYSQATDSVDGYIDYINDFEEINAYFVEAVNGLVDDIKRTSTNYHRDEIINNFDVFYKKLIRHYSSNYRGLTPDNIKRLRSRAYAAWEVIRDEFISISSEEYLEKFKDEIDDKYRSFNLYDYVEDGTPGDYDFWGYKDEKDVFFDHIGAKSNYLRGLERQVAYRIAEKYWQKYLQEK